MTGKEQLIERVMDDIDGSYDSYRTWIISEMRKVVEQWDEESLKDFLGIGEE